MKVLIIDDSRLLRDRIRGLIGDVSGVEIVGEAENSEQAIEYINKYKPDLMTLDIRMPGVSGVEVLREVRRQNISIITIVLTNYPLSQYEVICRELGAEYFFDKSSEYEMVGKVISEIQLEAGSD